MSEELQDSTLNSLIESYVTHGTRTGMALRFEYTRLEQPLAKEIQAQLNTIGINSRIDMKGHRCYIKCDRAAAQKFCRILDQFPDIPPHLIVPKPRPGISNNSNAKQKS